MRSTLDVLNVLSTMPPLNLLRPDKRSVGENSIRVTYGEYRAAHKRAV